MKKQALVLSLILTLCFAILPTVSALPDETAAPIEGTIHPGSQVSFSGTSAYNEVIIKVYRPNGGMLYFNVVSVVDGQYRDSIVLGTSEALGTYQVRIGQGERVTSTSFVVTANSVDAPSTGPGTIPADDSNSTTPVDGSISGTNGGKAENSDAKIQFPGQVFPSNFKVKIERLADASGLKTDKGSAIVGNVLSITKDQSGDFLAPVTITMTIEEELDTDSFDYAIYWYNETIKQWVVLDNIKLDPASGSISGDVNHFTLFAVLATEKEMPPVSGEMGLSDVSGHWAEPSIRQLVEQGAITGYPDGTFLPDRTMTRAEFVQVLVNAFGLEQQGDRIFRDTDTHWARQAISTAVAHGIVSGYDDIKFGPDDLVTREQIAAMITRIADIPAPEEPSSFVDSDDISPWARESVAAMTEQGIIKGYTDGSFKPGKAATRAEAAAMIVLSLP